jgi:hypothetical protein
VAFFKDTHQTLITKVKELSQAQQSADARSEETNKNGMKLVDMVSQLRNK